MLCTFGSPLVTNTKISAIGILKAFGTTSNYSNMLCKATMHAFAHRASLAARAPAPTAAVQHLSRGQRAIFARSGEGGVQDLIGRDRK